MGKTIVCYGDSNTYGSDFASPGGRLDRRWPVVLAEITGNDYEIKEEGLSGRTVDTDDTLWDNDLNGTKSFIDRLQLHSPIYLLIIMLGTNDVKEKYDLTAEQITQSMKRLIELAKDAPIWQNETRILLISPTPVGDGVIGTSRMGQAFGAVSVEKSKQLGSLYKELAKSLNCYFLDAAEHISVGTADFVHLSAQAHNGLANAVAQYLKINLL